MLQKLLEFFKEKGQGIVEYAMILGFVAVIAIALLANNGLKGNVESAIGNVDTVFSAQNSQFNESSANLFKTTTPSGEGGS